MLPAELGHQQPPTLFIEQMPRVIIYSTPATNANVKHKEYQLQKQI